MLASLFSSKKDYIFSVQLLYSYSCPSEDSSYSLRHFLNWQEGQAYCHIWLQHQSPLSSCLARCLPSLLLLLIVWIFHNADTKKLLRHCQILWYTIIKLIWKALRCINFLMVQFHLLCVNYCSIDKITLQLLENYFNHFSNCIAVFWTIYCDTHHAVTDNEHINIAHLCSSCICGDRLQSLLTLAVLILAIR